MQRHEVRLRDELVELVDLDARGQLLGRVRVEADDVHAEADAALGDLAADVPEADHAQRLAGDLDTHELLLLPHAPGVISSAACGILRASANIGPTAMLGGGGGVALRRVDDEDVLGAPRP